MRIKPFPALRPAPGLVRMVACPPYDVVSREEAEAAASRNEHCFLHVTRAEVDLPGASPHCDEVYAKASQNFAKFRGDGVLERERNPCLYLYRLTKNKHVQHGVVACCHVDERRRNVIRIHEKTHADKVEDRARLQNALKAQPGLVLMFYRDEPGIVNLTQTAAEEKSLYDFVSDDGTSNTVWRISDALPLVEAFRKVGACYIADGHHRCEAAVRLANARGGGERKPDTFEEYDWFLAGLFPAGEMHIHAYNRVVRDLGGMSGSEFISRLKASFAVTADGDPEPRSRGTIAMYLEKRWHNLTWKSVTAPDPVASLDVSVLHSRILDPLLGAAESGGMDRVVFVGGTDSVNKATGMVDRREGVVAFSLHPLAPADIMAVADAYRQLPPKSTWFEPKLMSGLLIHEL